VKTEDPSACVTVNCKVRGSAIELKLPLVASDVYRVSINSIIKSKTRLEITHNTPIVDSIISG
jgi:hypothetical protein